ncbi:elongator complex protein 5 [Arctopsyche grandis]|uniref:elongator complex protein 5 n=1 Tax=Arctopsyche grandis TaxID=121162 RepID=UPI00406D986A
MANTRITGKLIVVEDSLSLSAKNIVNYFFDKKNIGILCLEKTPNQWKSTIKGQNSCKYYIDITDFTNSVKNNLDLILIDSVNQLAALSNWQDSLKFISQLTRKNGIKDIVLIIHNDCLIYGDKMLKHMRHMSQTYIALKCAILPNKCRAEITSLSSGGKIVKTLNDIYFDGKWHNVEVKADKAEVPGNKKPSEDVFQMTSFKIAVEKEAEAVKDDLILPYTEAIKSKNKLVAEPDYDDWDDEDPDDDLFI